MPFTQTGDNTESYDGLLSPKDIFLVRLSILVVTILGLYLFPRTVLCITCFVLFIVYKKRKEYAVYDGLFNKPPQPEDCPICFLPLPHESTGYRFQSCCGKVICCGCLYAGDIDTCPFCRILAPTSAEAEETIVRGMKRVESGDVISIHHLGLCYYYGNNGLTIDYAKALELFHRAGELGYAASYNLIGSAYNSGIGVGMDTKMALHYFALAAIGGDSNARYTLGCAEAQSMEKNHLEILKADHNKRAIKHFMIAVRAGHNHSLNKIQQLYSNGHATKDEYEKALVAYQAYLGEIRSDQRDKAAAVNERYKYY